MKRVLFFKFTTDKYLDSILDGNLFMNTYSHYRETEEIINRGDKQEGVASSYKAETIKLSIKNSDGELVHIGGLINRVNFMYPFDHQVNIFCMSAFEFDFLNDGKYIVKLDERLNGFGNKAILITQPQEFIDKITNNIKGKESPPCSNKFFDKVDYLPNSYNGHIGCFAKLSEYEWQNEWRVAIRDSTRDKPEAVTLKIGDIRSICNVYDTELLIGEGLSFSFNESF